MSRPEHCAALDLDLGTILGAPRTERRLADLAGCFADESAWRNSVAAGNPLVYSVATFHPAQGEGQLHCGLGQVQPGKVGREYFFTKGHYHTWRAAAEMYVGLRGHGLMLLQEEQTGTSRLVTLRPCSVVYVPGHTAHRTINTGTEALVFLGIYPAGAGHDYETLATRPFRNVVVEQQGRPTLLDRARFLSDS